MKIGEEIFSVLKGFGYLVELYGEDGKGPMSSPELAEYVYAKDKMSEDSVMIRIPKEDTNEYRKVVIYKSHAMSEKFKKLLMTIKNTALKYGDTVTFRQFGRNIEPKDLAYIPKGEQELENAAMKESMNKTKCQRCHGSGMTQVQAIDRSGKDMRPRSEQVCTITCPMCNGKGHTDKSDSDRYYRGMGVPVSEDVVPFKKKESPRVKKMTQSQIHDKLKVSGIKDDGKLIPNVSGVPEKVMDVVDEGNSEESPLGVKLNWQKGDDMNEVKESVKYQRYGTTRSSYHVLPEGKKAKVIIRHSKKVIDEESVGARSRNVKNLYVEAHNGERRLIETKSLMAARAVANHVNYGGKLFDDTSNKILQLSEDIKKIKKLKRKYPVSEDASNKKIHESLTNVSEGLTDFMHQLNTDKINTLAEALNLSEPHVAFASAFYSEKLGESYDCSPLARGSVLYTRTRKFLSR